MEKSTTIREKMTCLQRNMSNFEDVFQLKTQSFQFYNKTKNHYDIKNTKIVLTGLSDPK